MSQHGKTRASAGCRISDCSLNDPPGCSNLTSSSASRPAAAVAAASSFASAPGLRACHTASITGCARNKRGRSKPSNTPHPIHRLLGLQQEPGRQVCWQVWASHPLLATRESRDRLCPCSTHSTPVPCWKARKNGAGSPLHRHCCGCASGHLRAHGGICFRSPLVNNVLIRSRVRLIHPDTRPPVLDLQMSEVGTSPTNSCPFTGTPGRELRWCGEP